MRICLFVTCITDTAEPTVLQTAHEHTVTCTATVALACSARIWHGEL
jgi:hypothetical protein